MFVYRTIDDVAALRIYVERRRKELGRTVRGAVIGGGLLGLEAAGALQELGATSTVIQFSDRLMNLQVDEGGGQALSRLIENMGVKVRCNTATDAIKPDKHGHVGSLKFADKGEQVVDVVVFATGVRPRDELARDMGLEIGARGGIVVDDTCLTEDPAISAIGEVACIQGACIGLIAPGNTMAEIAVDRLLGGSSTFPGADTAAKAKAPRSRRGELWRRLRDHARCARAHLRGPGGGRLQEGSS
ncbi:hypothetical protein GCM10025876_04940 [Demequina litorisediminis]|uniref:FAD/NAD(P)-binding domain-containing protein n=1 Tax=Demequina litorisediminis TaxID=1849022 RepID=A0ABQ6IAB8_9MICO|nr:hypothetical protein GCM10025876_04940 [Demequina litorisediminis]